MRRLAVLGVLALLLLASSAQAQKAAPPAAPPVAAKPKPALAPVVSTPVYVGPSLPPRSPLPSAAADAVQAQCSASCGRTLYTCQSGDERDLCASDWAQCKTSCGIAARRAR